MQYFIDAQDILRGNVMRAISTSKKHMIDQIEKTSRKKDQPGPQGSKGGIGEKGVNGSEGAFGPKGPRGDGGPDGPPGSNDQTNSENDSARNNSNQEIYLSMEVHSYLWEQYM